MPSIIHSNAALAQFSNIYFSIYHLITLNCKLNRGNSQVLNIKSFADLQI